MIIALPIDEKNININVSESFGRSKYFILYNDYSEDCIFVDNRGLNSEDGAGIEAAQTLIDHHADVVFLKRCGKNVAKVLEEAGIKLYEAQDIPVLENVKLYRTNNLKELENIHEGYHGHGGN
ncbi:MAG: dinitrogenase iron-molybdenum cofactor biosynthesis protein [Tissierellia bacterium]|nr:dinitrogenase iron-molybdenum cofactor biosynthesis protein [Tissierellia bacterium]